MPERNGGSGSRAAIIALVAINNLLVAAMGGYLLNDFKEFKQEIRISIQKIEDRARAQDDLSAEIRHIGFERLGKIETLLEEHDRRMETMELHMRSPTFKSTPGGG